MKCSLQFLTVWLAAISLGVHALAPIERLDAAEVVSDSYIVTLKEGISDADFDTHLGWADSILRTNQVARKATYNFGKFRGYSVAMPLSTAKLLAVSDKVERIEADQTYHIEAPVEQVSEPLLPRQTSAPWNLVRISHRSRGATTPAINPNAGLGTYIYVVDTGILTSHQQFEGRASLGYNAAGGSHVDDNGHGTHIAGTAAAKNFGVAPKATVISVKVFGPNGSGSTSTILDGYNWAINDIVSKGRTGSSTVLLALGGSKSATFNKAVADAANSGVFTAVAAGGQNADAGNYSPGSEPTACTVGGTTIDDARASSSNFGSVVDIFAPGQNIISTWNTGNTATNTISGTSMSAAHIAGLGAQFLGQEGARTPVALCNRLREVATKNVLSNIPSGTANLLAYNNSGL